MSWTHPFGTDGGGKDLFSQVLVGARTTLTVVVLTVLLSAVIGVILGVLSSITPRYVGESIAHVIDIVIALPTLILALVLLAALGGSVWTVSLALGIGSGVVLARVVKGEVARVLTQDYVLAASASGSSTLRTVVRHVFPNIAPVIIVQLSLIAALAVLSEAALELPGLDTGVHAVVGPDAGAAPGNGLGAPVVHSLPRARRGRRHPRVQPAG